MKKCSRCQAENFEDQKFCNLCGKELAKALNLEIPTPAGPPARKPQAPERNAEQKAYQHFLQAKEEIKRKDLPTAIRHFQAAVALCPSDPAIKQLLQKTVDAYERAKNAQKAAGPAARPTPPAPRAEPPRMRNPLTDSHPGLPARETASWEDSVSETRAHSRMSTTIPGLDPEPSVSRMSRTSSGVHRTTNPGEPVRRSGSHELPPPMKSQEPPAEPPRPKSRISGAHVQAAAALKEKESKSRPTSTTGRFLEAYGRAPGFSPALALDARDEGMKEILVSFLILGSFVAFGFLLLL
jgi:hypothetical protein